jgi:hypothetical protein
MRVSGFPKRNIDLQTTAQIIDWLGRASLVYALSKPLLEKLRQSLIRLPKIGFWTGDTNRLLLMTIGREHHPAVIKEEDCYCLLCFSKSPTNVYMAFIDQDWEEIIPVCSRCCKDMVLARKRGKELMTDAEKEVWRLLRFAPSGEAFDSAIDHLNKQRYANRELRKKFLKRVGFPMDAITYYDGRRHLV